MGEKYSEFISFIMNNSKADDDFFEKIKNNPKELKKQWNLFKKYYETPEMDDKKPNRVENAASAKQALSKCAFCKLSNRFHNTKAWKSNWWEPTDEITQESRCSVENRR